MNEEQHLTIQSRYYIIIAKMEQLETQIINTLSPTAQSLLRTDLRALQTEKEQIMNDLIDVKPCQ